MPGVADQKTILYIAGAGRSGSTLIEMILGNLPGFFSVGEIRFFWEYMARHDMLCGCGEKLEACPFWSSVAATLRADTGIDLASMASAASRFDRTRQVLLIDAGFEANKEERRRFVQAISALYHAVFQRSGAQVVVDSSKTPTHLRLLHRTDFQDIRVLHLIRDGRAVAYSWSRRVKRELAKAEPGAKMPSHSPLQSIIVWMFENAWVARSKAQFPYVAMRYEDFVASPGSRLSSALAALNLPANLSMLDQAPVKLSPTHSVGGNPIRFSPQGFQIRLDQEWRQELSRRNYLALSVLGFPMLKSYGYIGRS